MTQVAQEVRCVSCETVGYVSDVPSPNWIATAPACLLERPWQPEHFFCSRSCLIGHFAPIQSTGETPA